MKRKLTLRLDDEAIEVAKDYAESHGTSVSGLVERFFLALQPSEQREPSAPSPLVRALLGAAEGATISEDDYFAYLEKKHR